MNMKNILTKQQIIKLGEEIQLYQNCIIKMDDMVECKKYAKAKGFIEFDMNTIYYLTTLVQSEALKFILNEEDNNEIGNFIIANKVNPINKDYIIQISGTIIGKNKYEGCIFYYVDIGNNKIVIVNDKKYNITIITKDRIKELMGNS